MLLSNLSLTNFRNYRRLEMEVPPHLVVVQGDNAQGKTNLLEAVYVLATTRSHRTTSDRELVNRSAAEDDLPVARLVAQVQRARGDVKVEIAMRVDRAASSTAGAEGAALSVRKRIRVNDIVRRAADAVGQLNAVMFSAQDIDLIAGTPALCRRYLDLVCSQIDSRYLRSLQRYSSVLPQRNRLLKLLQERRARADQLEFWDRELVENGSYLVGQRQHSVARLNELAREIHWETSGAAERLSITYVPSVGKEQSLPGEIEARFRQALERGRDREVAQGMTLVGPHRDSLRFQTNGIDAGAYGSRGQQRTVALSLRLAEAKYMQAQTGDSPVLLLDDVLSELDQPRREHLLEAIIPFQQVLITATDLDRFLPSFLAQASLFRVRQGSIEQL